MNTTIRDGYWDQPIGDDCRAELTVIDSMIHRDHPADAGCDQADWPYALDWQAHYRSQRPAVYASSAQAAQMERDGIDMLARDALIPARPLTAEVVAYIDATMIGRATDQHMRAVIADWRGRSGGALLQRIDAADTAYWDAERTLRTAINSGDGHTPGMVRAVDAARAVLRELADTSGDITGDCWKCDGTGRYYGPGGDCWSCAATGQQTRPAVRLRDYTTGATIVRRVQTAVAEREAEARRQSERHATAAAFAEQHDLTGAYRHGMDLMAERRRAMDTHHDDGDFWSRNCGADAQAERQMRALIDLTHSLVRYGSLSDRQVAYMRSVEQSLTTADEPRPDVVTGDSVTITGEIVSMSWKETAYGSRHVMTVRDDRGFTVWGSVPAAASDMTRGDRITLTAQVTVSDRDSSFGFYKRPRAVSRASA